MGLGPGKGGRRLMSVITYTPVTPERWEDLESLFGPNGACSGCWCTWWRLSRKEFSAFSNDEKKNVLRTVVQSGAEPGLLAYVDGKPAGWVSVGPREAYPALERSRVLKRVDDAPTWCINCFFIDKHFRHMGLMSGLIEAAVAFARERGATLIEAYPMEPHAGSDSGSLYYGVASTFQAAGFVEVARRSEHHPVMRLALSQP